MTSKAEADSVSTQMWKKTMAPSQPASASPTSLLWAHKLQLEHGYLLQRMQNLEAKSEAQETRLADAENQAQTAAAAGVTDLAEKVKAIDDADVVRRMGEMERDVGQNLDDAKAGAEAVKAQIAAVQDEQRRAKEEMDDAAGRDRELLKQIGEVEDVLKKYERSLEMIGKRLNQARFEQVKARLVALTEEVKVQGEAMKFLPESIKALEKSNGELRKAVVRNEGELRKMAAKANGNAGVQRDAPTLADEAEEPPKKKSHKWSGGGADRDIIRLGSDLFGSPGVPLASPQMAQKEVSKQMPRPNPIPRKKQRPTPPRARHSDTFATDDGVPPKKPHRWAGGGADRDIIETGQRHSPHESSIETELAGAENSSEGFAQTGFSKEPVDPGSMGPPEIKRDLASTKQAIIPETGPNEVVTRTGKGWYEVAFPETRSPAVKRKRGRPRKEYVTPQWNDEGLLLGRSTRRMKYSPQDHSTARKRDAHAASQSQLDERPVIKKERVDDSHDSILVQNSLPQTLDGHSSAVGSQAPRDGPIVAQHFVVTAESAVITQADEADSSSPIPPQRVIIQDEDYETFMARDE